MLLPLPYPCSSVSIRGPAPTRLEWSTRHECQDDEDRPFARRDERLRLWGGARRARRRGAQGGGGGPRREGSEPQAAAPDRGAGARAPEDDRRGPVLRRHHDADLERARGAARGGTRADAEPSAALRHVG